MFSYQRTEIMSTSTDSHFDSIMFDMDGTLWDAVTSYCTVWNATIRQCCPDVPEVTYDRLVKMMGRPLDIIFNEIIGTAAPYDHHRLAPSRAIGHLRGLFGIHIQIGRASCRERV